MTEILNRLIAETGCTKEQAISALLAKLVEDGATVRGAFDALFGAGAYANMAGDIHAALRAA